MKTRTFEAPNSEVNNLLNLILTRIKSVLGDKLVGLYLGGSLVLGDFDPNISDIDLVAALTSEIDDKEFKELKNMHAQLVQEYKPWHDRVEVCYVATAALKKVKISTDNIVNISPGEPIHRIKLKPIWVTNWYLIRQKGRTLFGPPPKTIIQPISKAEFIQSVKQHAQSWNKWILNMHTRSAQAYAILTMCRALYAYTKGNQTSKAKAALWAQAQLPQWAGIIQNALTWRQINDKHIDKIAHQQTVAFVNHVRDQILQRQD